MPALTAHRQLSELVFETLKEDIKALIEANFPMYIFGAQGPDLLFYFKPYKQNELVKLGGFLHSCTGAAFFKKQLKRRTEWSAPLRAYLLGICCHYALDRNIHPFVYKVAPSTREHQSLEAEFDLHIIKTFCLESKRFIAIPKFGIDANALHEVYENIDTKDLKKAAKSFRKTFKYLQYKRLVICIEKILGKNGDFSSLCLPKQITSDSEISIMFELFNKSVTDAAHLMDVLLHGDEQEIADTMNNNFKGELK